MALTAAASRGSVEVNKVWRTLQTPIFAAFGFMTQELKWFESINKLGTPFSLRSLKLMLDLNEGGRVASLVEGGWKANPTSPNAEEGDLTAQHFDVRFTMTELSRWADKGNANQLTQQFGFQAKKAMQGMGRHIGDYIHGSSSGVLALTDTNVTASATDTLTLISGYGNTAITNAAFIADKLRETVGDNVGDRVAVVNGSTVIATGTVTARNTSTPTITITYDATPAGETTNGLKIVKANSMEAGLTESSTDFNKGLPGFQDMLFASAYHSLTHANWSVARGGTAGNRMNGIRIRRLVDEIQNYAPEEFQNPDTHMTSQGVHRDMINYERPALKFNDAFGMEVEGDVKNRGRTWRITKRVMPGLFTTYNSKAIKKIMITPMPDPEDGDVGENDGVLYPDRSLLAYDIPVVLGLVCTCRKAFAYETGLTEQ
jgi:hypothetical protein